MSGIRLYLRYVGVSMRSQMQYRASFVMLVLGNIVTNGIEIIGIAVLFSRFRSLGVWRFEEVAFLYGIVNVAFAIAEGAGRGFDMFSRTVRTGDFDRMLLRPRGTALQVGASEMQLMRLGRLLQGLVVLVWAAGALGIEWTAPRLVLVAFAIAGGACLFIGLFVAQATLSFWTTETLELLNILTYGGTETAQYPLSIYRGWFRRFFTFVVPLACISYFPALAILGREGPGLGATWFGWVAPAIGVLFLVATLRLWRFGVRHYRSTGS